jgi:alpha-glucosidase (family GH31 glycosyl hydrolase)
MILSLTLTLTTTLWRPILPGVWTANIGRRDTPTLTEASASSPRKDRISKLPYAQLPFDLDEVKLSKSRDYSTVKIPLQPGEKIYGLGLQMSGSNRRGGVYHLQVDHYDSGQDRLHAPTPMYVSSLGYAVFFNTSRPINVYVGVGNRLDDPKIPKFKDRNTDRDWDAQPDSGCVEASVQAPGLEVSIFSGPDAMNALQRYNLYCGGGAMPPLWALGFWHRTPSLATADQVLEEVKQFEERDFPLDVIGLEPGWQSRSYPGSMEWSPNRFPDAKGFVNELTSRGIRVNLWENPYVAPGTDLYQKLTPNFGSHTVWLGAAPDILSPTVAKVVQQFHTKHHLDIGVSGYKIDEVDGFDNWLWPDHATFPSGLDGLQMRQIYGLLWQKVIDQMFRAKGERTFGLVRGSNGAASRFPFAIYSDTYNHRQYVTALTSCSLAGVTWCAEIRSADTDEEWVRRMQSACLSPIAQLNAWDSGKKPWSYPKVEDAIREAMKLRESLVPYLYTAFAQSNLNGIPPVRPMSLVDGGEETDQYLLGDNLLFAPMFTGEKSRKVRLPKGKWYDYSTGRYIGSVETITISPSLTEIPLYVRGGTCIPTNQPSLRVKTNKPYLLRCYGEEPYSGMIYEDDGTTFAFEKGEFNLSSMLISGNEAKITELEGKTNLILPKYVFKKIGTNERLRRL